MSYMDACDVTQRRLMELIFQSATNAR